MTEVEENTSLDTRTLAAPLGGYPWPRVAFVGFVALYTGLLAWFCSVKVMAFDEMLSFYTERAPSVAALLALQRNHPVSLDPPLMHLAAHCALRLGVNPIFCVRLPSLVGAILMIACIAVFVWRLAGAEIAAFSVVGLLIIDQFHMVEARPYGALLGFAALALVLWQNAVRGQHRTASLTGLFLALGFATGSHYFGILLVLPFLAAESVRAVQRRKLDFAMLAALSGSFLFATIWLPYLQGARQYKANYYTRVKAGDLASAYVSSLQSALHLHSSAAGWLLCGLALGAVGAGAWVGYRGSRQAIRSGHLAAGQSAAVEWTVVAGFALLPVAGVGLAMLASGAFETRYVAEFTLGTVICLSAGLVRTVPWRPLRALLLVAGCTLALAGLIWKARSDRAQRRALEALAQRIEASGPSTETLITDKEEFLWLHLYPGITPKLAQAVWVADLEREVAASKSDNIDRTMLNLKLIAGLPVISYDQVSRTPFALQMIVNSKTEPVNWLANTLTTNGMHLALEETIGDDSVYRVEPAR